MGRSHPQQLLAPVGLINDILDLAKFRATEPLNEVITGLRPLARQLQVRIARRRSLRFWQILDSRFSTICRKRTGSASTADLRHADPHVSSLRSVSGAGR